MNDWQKIDLCGDYLLVLQRHADYLSVGSSAATYADVENLAGGTAVPAQVPGNFELDLARANLLPDPFFGDHILQIHKMEDRHVYYAKKFDYAGGSDAEPRLVFEGIDTVAEIYLNGKPAGVCENMLIEQEFSVAKLLKRGRNELTVHIFPACIAARKNKVSAGCAAFKYNYETMRLRKAPHMFGWDIMPRLVSAGIFRPVRLEFRPAAHFKQVYLMTSGVDAEKNEAKLQLFYEIQTDASDLSRYRIEIAGKCEDSSFFASERLWFTAGKIFIQLRNARLWWPKGYGEAALYDVTVSLIEDDTLLDTYRMRTGVRTVRLERTGVTDPFFNGKFHFEVNGRKIFILGTNFVPIDAFHSRDRERLPRVTALLDDIGCNAIRCWGGGVYEDDYLYDRCDELGVLIWQDFAMACAVYPTDNEFCETLRNEAEIVVRRLRQHPAVLVWAGDNECDQAIHCWGTGFPRDPNSNHLTRRVLRDVIDFEDPTRPYIPSSPFIDEEANKIAGDAYLTEQHLWGPRDYYKSEFYKSSLCNFVSEIGYQGCPSRTSVEKFIPKDKLWPWQNNDIWRIHASSPETADSLYTYRIDLMAKQIGELFGTVPDNLNDFILASQISQAEAVKFFIELFRGGQKQRTGIIWWNLIDGWPQFSDAVVDYYFEKKLAYYYIKQVQSPVLLSVAEPDNWGCNVKLINDTGKRKSVLCRVIDETENSRVLYENRENAESGVSVITRLPYSRGEKKIYVLEWEADGENGRNHYLAGNPPFDLAFYREFLLRTYQAYIPK